MIKTVGELLTGEKVDLVKTMIKKPNGEMEALYTTENDAVIYGDTDSVFFKTYGNNKEESVQIADIIATSLNKSFPDFLQHAFNCTDDFKNKISVDREIVSDRGIFLSKKKYVLHVVDKEGKPPVGDDKIKVMGSEMKRSDTPEFIQDLLTDVVIDILSGGIYASIETKINGFRSIFKSDKESDKLEFAAIKSVNNLDHYFDLYTKANGNISAIKKARIPGHVIASINTNFILKHFNDMSTQPIISGEKVKIFYVKRNEFGLKAIALSSDEDYFPDWFVENFELDTKAAEGKLLDNKLERLFAAIGWEVPTHQSALTNSILQY